MVETNGADVVDQGQVERAELQRSKVEVVEDTSLGNDQESVKLLHAQKGDNVEGLGSEESLKLENVEVVVDADGLEETKVKLVDAQEVVEIGLLAEELVEFAGVDASALLVGRGGGESGDGGGESGEDAELHGCGCWEGIKKDD